MMMMTSMGSISPSSSLMEDDFSFWSSDLPKNEFQDGASLDTIGFPFDELVTSKQDQKSSNFIAGDLNNPLPEWMSEKLDVSDWLDDLADNSASQVELKMYKTSSADKLLNTMVTDEPLMLEVLLPEDHLDDEQQIPDSPGSSIWSGGTAVNSGVSSPSPSRPSSSMGSGYVGNCDSFQDISMDDGSSSLELLLNSCRDPNVFLKLADSFPADLPIPAEVDIRSLQEDASKMQRDLEGKVKSSKGKGKSKGVTKERKERKKGQNKEAATRYRQKKKLEADGQGSELDVLEKTNGELKGKVGSLEQEIRYLKDLLEEIYKVKGQIQILQSP